jgi:hypothetical protein
MEVESMESSADRFRFAGWPEPRKSADEPSKRQKVRFVKITYDKSSVYVRPNEVDDMIDRGTEYELEGYTLTDVWMSEAEFEALPEFAGW